MSERGRKSKNIRIEEVARVAGVSPITVSRAIGNPGRVSDATRVKVLEAVSQTGYVVNTHASSLATGRSSLIPVFVSNLRNPHFATALQGASDAAREGRQAMADKGVPGRVRSARFRNIASGVSNVYPAG